MRLEILVCRQSINLSARLANPPTIRPCSLPTMWSRCPMRRARKTTDPKASPRQHSAPTMPTQNEQTSQQHRVSATLAVRCWTMAFLSRSARRPNAAMTGRMHLSASRHMWTGFGPRRRNCNERYVRELYALKMEAKVCTQFRGVITCGFLRWSNTSRWGVSLHWRGFHCSLHITPSVPFPTRQVYLLDKSTSS